MDIDLRNIRKVYWTCFIHCVESFRIGSYSGGNYLSGFSPNRENADQNNTEYGHFLRSVFYSVHWPILANSPFLCPTKTPENFWFC